MDTKTLKALKGSIRKWQRIVKGAGEDYGGVNCPLCQLFVCGPTGTCSSCPVMQKTGRAECYDSPYFDARDAMRSVSRGGYMPREAATPKAKLAAQKEVDFLKSLLPKPPRKKK